MLGQPVYFLAPDVVGVHLTGTLSEGVTATDLALTVTQLLRKTKVVGKFVEFFGPGAAALPLVDRATIANMAPEYGATMGFFPIDEECVNYLRATGRSEEHCKLYENYYKAQGLWGIPQKGQIEYSQVVELDLAGVRPSVAGPKRPQDRIELGNLRREFFYAFQRPVTENGFGKTRADFSKVVTLTGNGPAHPGGGSQEPVLDQAALSAGTNPLTEREMVLNRPSPDPVPLTVPPLKGKIRHGSVLIAAITSCTNTSNPSVMLAAGLLAKKAVERAALKVNPIVRASPRARIARRDRLPQEDRPHTVSEQTSLQQRWAMVARPASAIPARCTRPWETPSPENDLVTASVLSGNRTLEARVHQKREIEFSHVAAARCRVRACRPRGH